MKGLPAITSVALLMFFSGCENDEFVNKKITEYENKFTEAFGNIDPSHDWSMATHVTADIDLSKAPEGTYEVKIFSMNPKDGGYLLKRAILNGSTQLHFDAIKGEDYVRIQAQNTSDTNIVALNGYYPVENGIVSTNNGGTTYPFDTETNNGNSSPNPNYSLSTSLTSKNSTVQVSHTIKKANSVDAYQMSWVVACEVWDASYDFDFNDIVFDLILVDNATASVEKSELYLRPLAAGFTKKAYIYYDKNDDGFFIEDEKIGEIHNMLMNGAPSSVHINVGGSWDVDPSKNEPIKLADIDLSYYESTTTGTDNTKAFITHELSKFKIIVDNEGQQEATEITAPRKDGTNIPQMLILPRGWDWPNETVSMLKVYPGFINWVQDKKRNDWISTLKGRYHTNPMK